jgi:translocation and assembly module TamA
LVKSKLLVLTALAGGILAAPLPAYAQGSRPVAAPTPVPTPTAAPANPRDPIIPQSEFDEEVPSLDPVLGRPLEPLDALPPPSPNATPSAPFPPVPGPVEDAPLGDPELGQPLPPLGTFDVQPAQNAEAAPEGDALPAIRYSLQVDGLDAIDLRSRFLDLSALEDARGEASTGAQVEARAREDEALAVRLLHSEGYYDAVVSSNINPVPGPDGRIAITINVVPGERYKFGQIVIAGSQGEAAALAREALVLQSGQPIVAANVEAGEANVLLRLPQNGYPFAQLGQADADADGFRDNIRDILLDPETYLGDYSLLLDAGPKARFRAIRTTGNLAFDQDHVELLARFKEGQLFDRRLMDDLREAMVATRLFSTVSAEPVRTGEVGPDGTEYVDILVRQEAGRARSLDASIGFATGEGLRLEGAWEHRNFFRPEGSIRAAAVLGTNEQSALLRLRFNNWGMRDRALLFLLEAGRRDFAAFEGYTARLLGLVTRESTPIWQKRWTYAYGIEFLATNEAQVGAPRISLGDAYFIGGLIGQLGYDRSNSLLDPTSGFRLTARVNPEASLRDGTDYYLRTQLDGSYYYPIQENFTLAGRVRLGSITGIERDRLAPSRRLYAGGGGSVRGFGFQRLGPRINLPNPNFDPVEDDPEDVPPTLSLPIGGRSLTELAIEGRYRFGNYGVVAFIDGGSVSDEEYPGFDDFRVGVGVGGRLYTNFGPLRIDIATPIGRREASR